ncbi:MAG: hypothetical protein J7493_05530 [Porphyrobacter sp.]|nr:hypothetical protein [Porphyrobacter sp.]
MKKATLSLLLTTLAVPAYAQSSQVPPTHIMGEGDNPNLASCRVSYAPIIDAIAAEMKVIKVPPASRQQSIDGKALVMYVNANVSPLRFEGKNTTTCTGYVALQLYVPRVMADPVSRKQRRTSLTYCNEGFNLTATRGEMQAEINEKVRYLAAQCINTYVQSEIGG